MFRFSDNHKTINEVYKMFSNSTLVVDPSYQRRSVWGEKDKIRLIETILLELVIPELFFWTAETDPDTGDTITHIVDGQQRITAIVEFINNEFKLKPQHLLEECSKELFKNKRFGELDDKTKAAFWQYPLMIIEIDSKADRDDIVKMFRRLNLTDYNLNDAEKRNSLSGEFASLARELSDLEFWEEYSLFNISDVKRMKDVEFCGSLILLYRDGIIDQTDQKALNHAYEDLQEGYDGAEEDRTSILKAIDLTKKFFKSPDSHRFLKRKAQLYTLFSVAFYILRDKVELKDETITNFDEFVKLYSIFDNDLDLSGQLNDEEKTLYDWLKKYKLASSEGLNKHTNRMIRYNVMKDFLFDMSQKLQNARETLYDKMKQIGSDNIQEDPQE